MLIKQLRCVFIHIPKCGGQSIELALLKEIGRDWRNRAEALLRPNSDPAKGPPRLAHLTAAEYVSRGYVTKDEWNDFFTFAIVRNPWSRVVSWHRYIKSQHSFRDFVLKHWPTPDRDNYEKGRIGYRGVIPQADYVTDPSVKMIGRLEAIQEDFGKACDALGIARREIPKRNVSAQGEYDYRSFYDDETAEAIADRYRRDIEMFGYTFDR